MTACKDGGSSAETNETTTLGAIGFTVSEVIRREIEENVELEVSGLVRNGHSEPIDLSDSAILMVGGQPQKPIFLASNPLPVIAAGEEREVLLPFFVPKEEGGPIVLEIGDLKIELE